MSAPRQVRIEQIQPLAACVGIMKSCKIARVASFKKVLEMTFVASRENVLQINMLFLSLWPAL